MSEAAADNVEPSRWVEITREKPGHSSWYVERFRAMVAAGDDLAGEHLHAEALGVRIATVLGGAEALLVCHEPIFS